ncbi:MAG TPA: cytochrome c biogenesis protein CcsA, partial [Verrucomicrobiales bacterium]|nr:cytochrome c biogenesis protein CcsA [Verrucomicrobiales bacterium]
LLTFHIASVSLGYGAVFLGAFLAAVYLIQRLFRSPTLKAYQKRLRLLTSVAGAAAVLTGIGVVSGSIWANAHLGGYFIWDARDTGGILVTFWSAAAWWGTRLRRITGHIPMLAACVGGVLVAWSWFGANAWQSSRIAQHGFSTVWTSLFVFTSIEAVLALSALLPAGCIGRIRRDARDADLIV